MCVTSGKTPTSSPLPSLVPFADWISPRRLGLAASRQAKQVGPRHCVAPQHRPHQPSSSAPRIRFVISTYGCPIRLAPARREILAGTSCASASGRWRRCCIPLGAGTLHKTAANTMVHRGCRTSDEATDPLKDATALGLRARQLGCLTFASRARAPSNSLYHHMHKAVNRLGRHLQGMLLL